VTLFFYLSKIFWWMINPANVIFLCLTLAVSFMFFKRLNSARFFGVSALIIYAVFGIFPIGSYMLNQLENRFPQQTEIPNGIQGIIVLGGIVNVKLTDARQNLALNSNVERIVSLVPLTEKYPDLPILFTGGAGLIGHPELNEANMLKGLMGQFIKGQNKVVFENKSRNTYENALYSKEIVDENGGGKWLLVTSARHMPRAVGAFRKHDIRIVPYPVDFNTMPDFQFGLSSIPQRGISKFSSALHEWLGLLAYYLTDKTSELFPSP